MNSNGPVSFEIVTFAYWWWSCVFVGFRVDILFAPGCVAMEFVKFVAKNVLGPVFEHDLVMVRARVDDEHGNDASEKTRMKMPAAASCAGDAILDPSGPRLIEGFQNWILFYQLTGYINLSGVPLYLSIVYRICVLTATNYIMGNHFVFKILFSNLLDINHKNPIFILLTILTMMINTVGIIVIFYTSTFKLRPLFKILETPRLCCVNLHTQNALGASTLKYMLVFFLYQSVLYRMMVSESFQQFIDRFNLLEFCIEYCAVTVYAHTICGLASADFYVRSCFGAWLLALKTNLECRRARFRHLDLRRKRQQQQQQAAGNLEQPASPAHTAASATPSQARKPSIVSQFCDSYLFVSLDDIQKSLNTMDDHLEVTRAIQTSLLVLVNLIAFLGCGVLYLMAYDVLAKVNDYYHGIILILLSCNYAFLIMLSYLGDSFVYYALDKLVQTIEDEYLLQETEKDLNDTRVASESPARRAPLIPESVEQVDLPSLAPAAANQNTIDACQSLLAIKPSDVLFCREFIVQFEDHLATPWSKLTFKSHLHMMGTFVTVVAAQIIFDSH